MIHACTLSIELTLDLDCELEIIEERDDDGCGSPSSTGNSMTGSRGTYAVCESVKLDMTDEEIVRRVRAAFEAQVTESDASVDSEVERYNK